MLADIRLARKLALQLEACPKQQCCILNVHHLVSSTLVKDISQKQKITHTRDVEMKLLAKECSCASVVLTTSHEKMRQSHHPTPWLMHHLTHKQHQPAEINDRHTKVYTPATRSQWLKSLLCLSPVKVKQLCKNRQTHIHVSWNLRAQHSTHTH